jgi:hypothetical protein
MRTAFVLLGLAPALVPAVGCLGRVVDAVPGDTGISADTAAVSGDASERVRHRTTATGRRRTRDAVAANVNVKHVRHIDPSAATWFALGFTR